MASAKAITVTATSAAKAALKDVRAKIRGKKTYLYELHLQYRTGFELKDRVVSQITGLTQAADILVTKINGKKNNPNKMKGGK